MYEHAIARTPAVTMTDGLREHDAGAPDVDLALTQHEAYLVALRAFGLRVHVLPPDPHFPDSVFVEDTALLTPKVAILTRPGAPSRRGEVAGIAAAVRETFDEVETVAAPGTVDGGDIVAADGRYVIGLSARTNVEGAGQVTAILRRFGYRATTVAVREALHLKSGVSCLDQGRLLVTRTYDAEPAFDGFERIVVPDEEAYAANALWLNGRVLLPAAYPRTADLVAKAGYDVMALEMSEFRKVDGSLTCLSLRW